MLLEKDIKKNSLEIRNLIKKEINKEIPKITESTFDVWKIITKIISNEINLDYFFAGDDASGSNNLRITKFFWEKFFNDFKGNRKKFFNDFKGKLFNDEGQSKKFKENLYKLLRLSVNKTPQKLKKKRTIPFKQQTKFGQTYALLGNETSYGNKHNPKNYYYYNYCNKTKIKFFKGPSDQEKKIIQKKWKNTFSESFIYGYILAAVKIICDLGIFESKKEDPKDDLSDLIAVFKKNGFTNLIYNQKYIENLTKEFYEHFYKINKNVSNEIYNEIYNSIFKSKLSHFLFLKKQSYFVYNCKESLSDESDGIGDFIEEIQKRKKKYLANSKNSRFINVILNAKKDRIKKIWPNTLSFGDGCIFNYEQFRFYTLSLPYLSPYTEKQLNINEKDIFIRYAVNLGVQEILFYVIEKIFSRTDYSDYNS
jgi:hypothetical protein